MTNEEKSILLQDLCARLPYGVKVKLLCRGPEPKFDDWIEVTLNTKDIELFGKTFKNIKPYLRPMSSMTEEEIKFMDDNGFRVYKKTNNFDNVWDVSDDGWGNTYVDKQSFENVINFFCSHHIDYRGLIPMGLALPAKEGMYK